MTATNLERASYPWFAAALMAVPAIGLALSAVVLPAPWTYLMPGAGLVALVVQLVVFQPRIEAVLFSPGRIEKALEDFLAESQKFRSVEDLSEGLEDLVTKALGEKVVTSIVAPSPEGGVQLASPHAMLIGVELGDCGKAFAWLGDDVEPLWRYQLEGVTDQGAHDAATLMDTAFAECLVPLRHRGELLGLVLIGPSALREARYGHFLRGLRTHVTTALANTFLNLEARGHHGVTQTLGLANTIQASLMPEEKPVKQADWELRGYFRPVADCGGDLWSWHALPNDKVLLVIADATGHGAGPALLSAVAKGTIDGYSQVAGAHCDPQKLLDSLNHAILRVGQRTFMMTAVAMVVDVRQKTLQIANAGQNFPFLIKKDGLEALVVRGDQLGAKPDATFGKETMKIAEGDKVLLYTDGIVEAGEPFAEPFGDRRFRRLVQSLGPVPASQTPNRIVSAVYDYLDGKQIYDDVTLVCFELIGSEETEL